MRYWPADVHAARERVIEEGAPDPLGSAAQRGNGAVLYVFVSSTCPVCDASLPFYRRLSASHAGHGAAGRVVFAGLEPEAALAAWLRRAGIDGPRVVSIFRPPGVPGTPSIVAVDAAGRVQRSWAGRLNARQEADVLAAVAAMSAPAADAAALLVRARAWLRGTRGVESVSAIEATGTETRLRDSGVRVDPYEFALRLPHTLRLRTGPLVHVLDAGTYSRHLVDGDRYGGPMVDRLVADPESMRTAARGMQAHLLRLSLSFLGLAPAADAVADEGTRDFGVVKGRTIAFRSSNERLEADLVIDVSSGRPRAVVTPVQQTGGRGGGQEALWISLLDDYRDEGGIRVPHRIDEWIGSAHSRVALTSVTVDSR